MMKVKKTRDKKHLKWVRTLPCCVSGFIGPVEAAHIRSGTEGGTGLKPGDNWVVPLNHARHNLQHSIGEKSFWGPHGGIIRAKKLAADLYANTGNTSVALKLIEEFRNDKP